MPVTLSNPRQATKTHLDWYGFRLAIGTTLACDPPGVFTALRALALPNWFEGAWYFGAAGPFKKKPHQSIQNCSLADKSQVKTNSWCKVRQNFSHHATGSCAEGYT